MKYITILCEMSNDRAKVGKTTYWLTKNTNIHGIGFALLEKVWQGSYKLLRFHDLDFMSLYSDFSLVEESERGENESLHQ